MGDRLGTGRPATSTPVRTTMMALYLVALGSWVKWVGLPKDTLQLFAWIWLATIAWNAQAPVRTHLNFPRDWSAPLAVLLIYLYSRGMADEFGLPVHVTMPIDADRAMFGGTLPTEYLQARLCGDPCEPASEPQWYDAALTTVYYSHFFAALATAWVLWLRNRVAWIRFMRRYLTLTMLALVIYIAYPMAPPWMAARDGYLTGDIARITGRGSAELGVGDFHHKLAAVGNPVAAMPSLHAGIAFLLGVYGVVLLRAWWRWLLLLYPAAMSFMLVYYAEHYVIDLIAGYAAAGVVLLGWSAWERRHTHTSRHLFAWPPVPRSADHDALPAGPADRPPTPLPPTPLPPAQVRRRASAAESRPDEKSIGGQ
jgi:hypothetical protein